MQMEFKSWLYLEVLYQEYRKKWRQYSHIQKFTPDPQEVVPCHLTNEEIPTYVFLVVSPFFTH